MFFRDDSTSSEEQKGNDKGKEEQTEREQKRTDSSHQDDHNKSNGNSRIPLNKRSHGDPMTCVKILSVFVVIWIFLILVSQRKLSSCCFS